MHQIESSSPPVVRAADACGSSNVQNMHGGAMVVRAAGLKFVMARSWEIL